ncbi:FAD-dependent oxidoreductase [Gemmata sp. G18]|uniref:FAD-dependent oxidoreductase n=1 Tax=Gemmata palustris TaxID=2822762 RepID=A0ABS5BWG0_9BACT|nr:FAD-dependent oxidoreductase [Gemmata palustris]
MRPLCARTGVSVGTERRANVAVVGGGIVGLAFAWEAARAGIPLSYSIARTGRRARPCNSAWCGPSASYRGILRARAQPRPWLELKARAGLWVSECGSLHRARGRRRRSAARVRGNRSAARGEVRVPFSRRGAEPVPRREPGRSAGGLHSPTELAVNPPEAVARLPRSWRTRTECSSGSAKR